MRCTTKSRSSAWTPPSCETWTYSLPAEGWSSGACLEGSSHDNILSFLIYSADHSIDMHSVSCNNCRAPTLLPTKNLFPSTRTRGAVLVAVFPGARSRWLTRTRGSVLGVTLKKRIYWMAHSASKNKNSLRKVRTKMSYKWKVKNWCNGLVVVVYNNYYCLFAKLSFFHTNMTESETQWKMVRK